ncbi:MAG: hypothetical protein MK212_17175, partial [Saprospiraceae bacterium]|nr:hypothetical protein [Saprospiraceae bacterium]
SLRFSPRPASKILVNYYKINYVHLLINHAFDMLRGPAYKYSKINVELLDKFSLKSMFIRIMSK